MSDKFEVSNETTQQELMEVMASLKEGQTAIDIVFMDTTSKSDVFFPEGTDISKPLILGDDLLFVQPDGQIVGLLDGAKGDFIVTADALSVTSQNIVEVALAQDDWQTIADAIEVSEFVAAGAPAGPPGGSGEQNPVDIGDPLFGIGISPLLPPTDFAFPEFEERDVGADGGIGEADVQFEVLGEALLIETDSALGFRFADYVGISAGNAADGEAITSITITLPNLPAGTTANGGSFVSNGATQTFTFTGTPEAYEALVLNFPTDFSTDSRSDTTPGDLDVSITATSNFGDSLDFNFPVTVEVEGDLGFVGSGVLVETETDAPVVVTLKDALTPAAIDADGSEFVDSVSLVLTGLPAGTIISTDPGNAINNGTFTFTGTLEEYEALMLTLPADFSTTNPGTTITGVLTATTNEGASDTQNFNIVVEATPDVNITAPDVTGNEDTNDQGILVDDDGTTVDLQLNIAVTDIDSSESVERVTIDFADLPAGTTFDRGNFTPSTGRWDGTQAEANALQLTFPGDYSGTVTSIITVTTNEGVATSSQTIVVAPTQDVDIAVSPIVEAETDATVEVNPSQDWVVTVTDNDGSEILQLVTLELLGLPAGVLALNVPGTTITTYDPVAGGAFVFKGTQAEYNALRLEFPTDFSTGSGAITGTIEASSNEGSNGPVPVSLTITPEGDAAIDVLPFSDLTEAETGQTVALGQLLDPKATDLDGSEQIDQLMLTITGLPGGPTYTLSDILNLPAGAPVSLIAAADQTQTLTVTLNSSDVGDVRAAFVAIEFSIPQDFSTANRSETAVPTSLPITVSASITTDEDVDGTVDGPADGQITAQAIVNVGFVNDIALTVPLRVDAQEDGGNNNSTAGATVPLGLVIAITDDDGSETEAPGSPFSAVVDITFGDLPAGTTVTEGTLTGNQWTGTVQEARDLALELPENYSGTVTADVTVTTLEGSQNGNQVIVVTPTPDINIAVSNPITAETDAPVEVIPSDAWQVSVTETGPGAETLQSITLELSDLPPGVLVQNVPASTITYDPANGGTFTFTGTPAEYAALRLEFPTDYSTQSVNGPALPGGAIAGSVSAVSSEGSAGPVAISLTITAEGDVRIDAVGSADLQETDAPVDFSPASVLVPVPTDADGSEFITQVDVTFNALPAGTQFSTDGVTFNAAPATLNFSGTEAEYNALVIRLPADYSTAALASPLTGTVVATTNEGGTVSESFDVTVAPEGDIELSGPRALTLSENDAPGVVDSDATTQAPVQFALASALTAVANDADGSETIAQVDVSLSGLPTGSEISLDNGGTFVAVNAGTFPLSVSSLAAYEQIIVRLPDDFSTESPASTISGEVTFTTDEALLNGETLATPNGGVASDNFFVTVSAEGDVAITGSEPIVIEDLGAPIDLGLAIAITDTDGSETVQGDVSVAFDGLPGNGPTILSDGTILTAGANTWTGDVTALSSLQIVSFPQHFSGIVTVMPTVLTNESGATGLSASFLVSVTPIAEPVISLSVDASETAVDTISADNFIVKEDASFLLEIDASTPDQDGSETLRDIAIENVPAGWLRAGDGPVDLALFEQGAGDIASVSLSGTTLTITLNPGVSVFDAALRVTPLSDDDRDIETIVGSDLLATVTAVDTAAGLADSIATAQDGVDVDVDAVVDGLNLTTVNHASGENLNGRKFIDAGFRAPLSLVDADGSESFEAIAFSVTVDTASDVFDPADSADLRVNFRQGQDAFVIVTQTDTVVSDNTVDFLIERAPGATDAEFALAITNMRFSFAQNFSGVATLDGDVRWNETQTGDVETDTSDNTASQAFQTVLTIRPAAEALLDAGLFVTDGDFVASGSPDEVTAAVLARQNDASAENNATLTLLESTADSSGPGQVQAFLRLNASTPDTDGSEELETLIISNVPSSWIGVAETTSNVTLTQSDFFALDGSGPITAAEFAKIDSAVYDAGTGAVTITFVPDVISFAGAVAVYPALYEDYDVDRNVTDPFTADGTFFGADLNFELNVSDTNSVVSRDVSADITVDVDVDPVNNFGRVDFFQTGNEQQIDDAGGVLAFGFTPVIDDVDGSETIISTVLRNIPRGITVYVTDPADPTGPKVPALLTRLNSDGTADWSLENDQWLDVELRGIPLHFAGKIPIEVDIVTQEADGGGIGSTTLMNVDIVVTPVADGGNPSEVAETTEDTAVLVQLDGNIIDNAGISAGSPESVTDPYIISNVRTDSEGRLPRFFDGVPNETGVDGAGNPIYDNEILEIAGAPGTYSVTPLQATTLHVLPGQDSSDNVIFDVTATYREDIDPLNPGDPANPEAVTTNTGTVTVSVKGIADTPSVALQEADPDLVPGSIAESSIDGVFIPGSTTDGISNADLVYAYAGYDDTAFQLSQRVSDTVLQNGFAGVADPFTAADPIIGDRSEITFADGEPDGSETLYYVITGVPEGIRFSGSTPVDSTGESYIVTEAQLANLTVRPTGLPGPNSDVNPTYYNMTINAVVLEADADTASIPTAGPGTSIQDVLDAIEALPGGSVQSEALSIMVLPSGNGVTTPDCPPDDPRMLPMPELRLVGVGDEDTANAFQIELVPSGPWNTIADLTTLPLGVSGDFGLGLTIPPGATLSADPSSAVLFDPVTGQYVIDFAQLGSAGTVTAGSIIYTPPANESSQLNEFTTGETLGGADPYDSLQNIEFTSVLNNYTCNDFSDDAGEFTTIINPVVDGAIITIDSPVSILEDGVIATNIVISSEDGGERQTGDVVVTLSGDAGAQLFGPSGLITPDGGSGSQYSLSPAELTGLEVRPTANFSGPITMTVSATTQDIDNSTLTSTVTRTIDVEPVADTPQFNFNPDQTPTETGLPLVTDPFAVEPIVTIAEDKPLLLSDVFLPGIAPDQDGSETVSAVIGPLPDYVVLGGSVINNGDGTFTVSRENFATLTISLADEHSRTPDSLDPTILAEVPINISVNTLELDNFDQASASTQFVLRVLPDADKPSVTAEISPNTGLEDDGTVYTLTLEGTTPDPHETVSFEVTVPAGSQLLIDGVAQTVPASGIVTVPGVSAAVVGGTTDPTFVPDGVVTFVPAVDFAGTAGLSVVAVSSDTSAQYSYTDTENSDVAVVDLEITGTLDLDLSTTTIDVIQADGNDYDVSLGINAIVTDTQAVPSETLDEVVVNFTAPLAAGVVPSDGVLSPDRQTLTLTRGALAPADFALIVAALALTVPAAVADPIEGTVVATTNHGASAPEALDITINARPEITGTVDIPQSFDNSIMLTFADLTSNAVDADTPLTVENLTSPDPNVQIQVAGQDVTITVPPGYVGTPILEYDVVDGAATPASSANVAELDFDTLQMQDTGATIVGPDGIARAVLSDVTGDATLGGTIAKGTGNDDAVIWDAVDSPYAGITEFQLMGGDDFIDLGAATSGYTVVLGTGDDIAIGSDNADILNGGIGEDTLEGGAGLDTLTGGAGADDFVLSSGPIDIADLITDFEAGDQIDLSNAINGVNDITGLASFDAATGDLDIGGVTAFNVAASGGGIPAQVEVVFEDASGAAQTAIL